MHGTDMKTFCGLDNQHRKCHLLIVNVNKDSPYFAVLATISKVQIFCFYAVNCILTSFTSVLQHTYNLSFSICEICTESGVRVSSMEGHIVQFWIMTFTGEI